MNEDVSGEMEHEQQPGISKEPVFPPRLDISPINEDISGKTEHEQQPETPELPVLPPKLDIRLNYGQEWDESEVDYHARISLGERIPRDGPEDLMRIVIASVVLFVWVGWVVAGFVRLALTGDIRMLLASPILLLFPLRVVLRYYFSRRRSTGGSRRSRRRRR